MQAKYQALLSAMIRQDVELVAEVFAFMEEVIGVRERIRSVLIMHAVELAEEDISAKSQTEQAAIASEHLFEKFDEDKSGVLSYAEMKRGLASLQIHITRQELLHIMRVIDPDLSGDLTKAEWHSFMSSTDGELEQRQVEANSEGQQAVAQGARQVMNVAVTLGSVALNPLEVVADVHYRYISDHAPSASHSPSYQDITCTAETENPAVSEANGDMTQD